MPHFGWNITPASIPKDASYRDRSIGGKRSTSKRNPVHEHFNRRTISINNKMMKTTATNLKKFLTPYFYQNTNSENTAFSAMLRFGNQLLFLKASPSEDERPSSPPIYFFISFAFSYRTFCTFNQSSGIGKYHCLNLFISSYVTQSSYIAAFLSFSVVSFSTVAALSDISFASSKDIPFLSSYLLEDSARYISFIFVGSIPLFSCEIYPTIQGIETFRLTATVHLPSAFASYTSYLPFP